MIQHEDKTKEELIKELQELQQENITLKASVGKELGIKKDRDYVLNKLIHAAKEFIQSTDDTPDYKKILRVIIDISGAKYAALNIFDENGLDFETVAFEGIRENVLKGLNFLGFEVENKPWKHDPIRAEKTKKVITRFMHLNELTGDVIPNRVINLIEKTFVVKIVTDDKVLGDFTLLFEKGKTLINSSLVELYADQVGLFLERHKLTNFLRDSEEKYRILVENLNEIIYTLDKKGKITYLSPNFKVISGYTPAEAIGKSFTDFVHPEDINGRLEQFSKVLSGINYPSEYRMVTRRGMPVWVRTSARPIKKNGRITGVQGVLTDITDLKESEENFKKLYDDAPVCYHEIDIEGRITRVNNTETALLGYTQEEMIGKYYWEFLAKGQQEMSKKFIKEKIFRKDVSKGFERDIVCKRGEILTFFIRDFIVLDSNGKVTGIRSTMQDITERKKVEEALKESEKQFRQLFENMEQGFAVHEMIYNNDNKPVDYRFLLINKAFERLTGVNASDFLNKTVKEVLPNTEQIWIDNWGKVAQTGIPLHFDNYSQEFDKYYDVIAYSPKKDFFAVVFTDITDLKESETKLQQLNADKDRFISILSHDLKSLFNNIIGFSELLAQKIGYFNINKIQEFANHINKAAHNANNLLEDLLKWARAKKGNFPFNPQSLNLTEICEDILKGLYQNADAKNIKINCSASDNIYVIADIDMLKTILRNLISNAIKFTNKGGEISINAEQTESDITITVSDNGIGIPPDNLSRLFDISEVITTTGTAQETGTGLGLLLCKEFVEKHGGEIWVESQEGKGTVFYFTIPDITDEGLRISNKKVN